MTDDDYDPDNDNDDDDDENSNQEDEDANNDDDDDQDDLGAHISGGDGEEDDEEDGNGNGYEPPMAQIEPPIAEPPMAQIEPPIAEPLMAQIEPPVDIAPIIIYGNTENGPIKEPMTQDDTGENKINAIEETGENERTNDEIIETREPEGINEAMDRQYGNRNSGHNLRARKPRDFGHMHTVLEHTVMTQHGMKKGIKEFGEEGTKAVITELQQLHDRDVLEPVDPNELTREAKREALRYLMFLTKKRCERIKGRGCADGRKQRLHTKKEDASSPTVAIEAVMLSCVIDAKERRDVGIIDIPGAFMYANMDEIVHMRLEGKMAELLFSSQSRPIFQIHKTRMRKWSYMLN